MPSTFVCIWNYDAFMCVSVYDAVYWYWKLFGWCIFIIKPQRFHVEAICSSLKFPMRVLTGATGEFWLSLRVTLYIPYMSELDLRSDNRWPMKKVVSTWEFLYPKKMFRNVFYLFPMCILIMEWSWKISERGKKKISIMSLSIQTTTWHGETNCKLRWNVKKI